MFRIVRHALMLCGALAIGSHATVLAAQDVPAGTDPMVQRTNGFTVRVAGRVVDAATATPLPGVTVSTAGLAEPAVTDVEGRYALTLSPGTHTLTLALDGFQTTSVRVTAESARPLELTTSMAVGGFEERVDVTADIQDAATSTAAAQLLERRRSTAITDNIGGEEMRRNSDGDAAAALTRVTGLSVVDGQYIFVRGLGERYSNTTLNGSVVPTTEPDKKVVPLDMFPSGLLNSVSVVKTFTPDRSAEFAGGLVEISPMNFPRRTVFDASYKLGRNSQTSGDVLGYTGSGRDWAGFDDGLRALPGVVPNRKVIRGGIFTPDVGVLRPELERIGEAFNNNWNLQQQSVKPNQNANLTWGTRFGRLGVLASYTQSYDEREWEERQVFYRTSDEGLSIFSDYDMVFGKKEASIGALGNVSFEANSSNRFTFQNFYTHTGTDQARQFEGFNSDIDTNIRNQRLYWIEEELLSTGLTGEHFFSGLGNSRIDWRATFSRAQRDEPDLREVLYEENAGEFVLADESQSGLRMFNTLDDDSLDVAANWSSFGVFGGRATQFKAGVQYVERTRDFASRRFRFVPLDLSSIDASAQPEQLYTAANIGPAFEIKEETRATDFYDAAQKTTGVFGMTDVAFSPRIRMVAGVRVERFDQEVNTFDLFDFSNDPEIVTASIEETDVFPSVNFVFAPRTDHNLRIGFSQTVNRPEFRELAEFEFTDIVGGRAIIGNPDLQRALIQNYDIRYEVFPRASEVLAASLFVKRFDDPIERIIEPTAQLRTSFTNAESARNVGFELEARRQFSRNLLVGGNYTWVDSNVTLTPEAVQVQTSLERALVGQSGNVFNLFGQVTAGPVSVRALYNYFDERISDVGAQGLPDIVEEGRGALDLVFSTRVRRLNIRFSAENLNDPNYEFTQGGQVQRLYKLGRTFAFSVGLAGF